MSEMHTVFEWNDVNPQGPWFWNFGKAAESITETMDTVTGRMNRDLCIRKGQAENDAVTDAETS